MWQRPEEEKKKEETKNPLDSAITDEIKEEDEGSDASDEEQKNRLDSPGALSNAASENRFTETGEGDDAEETFMSLDEALSSEFDINKVSKLDQRLKDVNR